VSYISIHLKIYLKLITQEHIAIPDFAAGAMENWGLIMYREARLLYDENKTSDSALQGIVSVMSHEQSHLWFGNLVSPAWWSNVWMVTKK
jgi:aminopeptidase N